MIKTEVTFAHRSLLPSWLCFFTLWRISWSSWDDRNWVIRFNVTGLKKVKRTKCEWNKGLRRSDRGSFSSGDDLHSLSLDWWISGFRFDPKKKILHWCFYSTRASGDQPVVRAVAPHFLFPVSWLPLSLSPLCSLLRRPFTFFCSLCCLFVFHHTLKRLYSWRITRRPRVITEDPMAASSSVASDSK